jgi:hypothetical protein
MTVEKQAYRVGEEFIRSWSVFNEGNEPIDGVFLTCVEGDCCSKA